MKTVETKTTSRQRFHDATGDGALTSPSDPQPKARVTYAALYPDGIGRTRAIADFGTNGDSALVRPDTVPTSSATVLVTRTLFNDRGEPYQTIDPLGRVDQTTLDDAGRRVELIENLQAVSSSSSSSSSSGVPVSDDKNRTTLWGWTADDLIATLSVLNASTGTQTTTYNYGSTLTHSDVARNDVLVGITYPDGSTVAYLVNRQSEVMQLADANGTVHDYTRDVLGRVTLDNASTLGTGIDDAVTQIARTYEVRGMPLKITALNASNVVQNEVEFVYNTFRQLITEYQEHAGAVDTSTTHSVQYAYADGSTGTIRRTQITSASGFVVDYTYDVGLDAALNRISTINYPTLASTSYTRIGAGTVVQVDHEEPGVSWSLINGTGADPYTGLDQFNRVADSRWFKDTTDLDRIKHGYDLAGNRLYRKNTLAEATSVHLDELYHYDGMYRINQFDRGTLNSTNTAITSGTLNYTQDWGLDSTGNWRQFIDQDHGAPSTIDQSRSANTINEITGITGGGWAVPSYDAVGNMTNVPLPVDMTSGGTAVYDAWNRLVSLAGGDVSSTSRYDGLGRRISHTGNILEAWTERYFSDNWQVLDEGEEVDSPARQRYVWGLRYIDDLILRQRGNQRLYALQDPNWNVTSVCDPFGTVKERYTYLAYGQPTFRDADFEYITASAYQWEHLFAGYRWDNESGLHYVRNRYVNPVLGTWLSMDPIGLSGGDANLLAYVMSSPIAAVDPLGLADILTGIADLEDLAARSGGELRAGSMPTQRNPNVPQHQMFRRAFPKTTRRYSPCRKLTTKEYECLLFIFQRALNPSNNLPVETSLKDQTLRTTLNELQLCSLPQLSPGVDPSFALAWWFMKNPDVEAVTQGKRVFFRVLPARDSMPDLALIGHEAFHSWHTAGKGAGTWGFNIAYFGDWLGQLPRSAIRKTDAYQGILSEIGGHAMGYTISTLLTRYPKLCEDVCNGTAESKYPGIRNETRSLWFGEFNRRVKRDRFQYWPW